MMQIPYLIVHDRVHHVQTRTSSHQRVVKHVLRNHDAYIEVRMTRNGSYIRVFDGARVALATEQLSSRRCFRCFQIFVEVLPVDQ